MTDYDTVIHTGDKIRNKTTKCTYVVKKLIPSPTTDLVVGHVGSPPKGLQDVILEDPVGRTRMAAAFQGRVMSCYWEKVEDGACLTRAQL